jgi:DNA-binding MarR family transcriptional regulator
VALLTLSRAAEIEMARLLEPHGLTLRKYGILSRIAAVPGSSTADLARRAGLTAADIAPLLRSLRDAGLTRPGDERSATVTITPAGAQLLTRLNASVAELDTRLFSGAGRTELAAALAGVSAERLGEPQD